MSSTERVVPIMLRASITREEHRAIKKRAIDADRTEADLIAEYLRRGLAANGKERA